jgi:hypothetical protein
MGYASQIVFVDIDNTICATRGTEYEQAVPILSRIARINRIFKKGNCVVYYTARGVGQAKDYSALTLEQLKRWGCLYNAVRFDKPIFDVLIDDRALPSSALDLRNYASMLSRWKPSIQNILRQHE